MKKIFILIFISIIPILVHAEKKREFFIPKYDGNRNSGYFDFVKQLEPQLGLSDLLSETPEIELRIWATYPTGKYQTGSLVQIVKNGEGYKIKFYIYASFVYINLPIYTQTIFHKRNVDLSTTADPSQIVNLFLTEKLELLDSDDHLPLFKEKKLDYGNPGSTILFEYSTPSIYRFYQYNNVISNRFVLPEAEKIFNFLTKLYTIYPLNKLEQEFVQDVKN